MRGKRPAFSYLASSFLSKDGTQLAYFLRKVWRVISITRWIRSAISLLTQGRSPWVRREIAEMTAAVGEHPQNFLRRYALAQEN
jgi:hypothetical protein